MITDPGTDFPLRRMDWFDVQRMRWAATRDDREAVRIRRRAREVFAALSRLREPAPPPVPRIPCPGFCGVCVETASDLEYDPALRVWACRSCREQSLRGGRWTYGDERQIGPMASGCRRVGTRSTGNHR